MCILIAVDDDRLSLALEQILGDDHYQTFRAADGTTVLQEALSHKYDLIILGIALPGRDGLTVIAELRRLQVQLPILVLTNHDSVSDKVKTLDAGADDYVTTPFAPEELLARVRALIRRSGLNQPKDLSFGDLTYLPGSSSMQCAGKEVRLNYKESELMKLLLSSPERILSKDELINKVWGYDSTTSENNVEAYISFLRKKLTQLQSRVSIIAIKKQGYKVEYHP